MNRDRRDTTWWDTDAPSEPTNRDTTEANADTTTGSATRGVDVRTPDGLRALLLRLHQAGPGAWRHDEQAEALMSYCVEKYADLARAHGLEPEDAASAAYLAMQTAATRRAADPWAVVTTAVRVSLIAEERAHGLLTSPERARRRAWNRLHDPERFGDRDHEHALPEYHPALATRGADEDVLSDPSEPDNRRDDEDEVARQARNGVEGAITLLVVLGIPVGSARMAIDYVCDQLIRSGGRARAYDVLRRDRAARALLDMTQRDWIRLLRVTLGDPSSRRVRARNGALARLMLGDRLSDLVDLPDLPDHSSDEHHQASDPGLRGGIDGEP